MGVSLRTILPLEDSTWSTMSPIPMELISTIPVLGDQDFNSFNLDEGILQNPDQHIGDIEEMFRSMDEQKLAIFPEMESDEFDDHTVDICDSRVADYMWNGMDVKNSVTRTFVKTNSVANPRPRSLLRSNLNLQPTPPPPRVMPVSSSVQSASVLSDGGSEYSEDSGRPETPNSISDSDEVMVMIKEEPSIVGYEDYSSTHSVYSRNYVPNYESVFIHSNDDEFANVPAVPLSEVTGQIIEKVWSSPASSTSSSSSDWIMPAAEEEEEEEEETPVITTTTPAKSEWFSTPVGAPARDPAAIAAATSHLINDHSYPLNRNGYPGIPGNLTPSDSEEDEIDVVNVVKSRPLRSSSTALPNNPTANDRQRLQRTVASKITPPQTPAASPAPSPPPSPPRRQPATSGTSTVMAGPSLNQMRPDAPSLVRTRRECFDAILTRRRREVHAHKEDEEHVRRVRQRETGFVPQPAPGPIKKEARVVANGMTIPNATELRPDWLVVCHNKRDRFRKSRARIEQDAWQNVQSVRKKHRQHQAMTGRRVALSQMSDLDSDEETTSSRRGRGGGANSRGAKRKHKRDLDSEERRSQHNHMERRRRVDLRESFDELRLQIPMTDGKAAKVAILEGAANRIRCLQNVEEQLLDEEERLLKDYFSLRVRLMRLSLPARDLEGWSDHDLVLHEVAASVEKMENAEGLCEEDDRESHDGVEEEVGVDDDESDSDEDDDEEMVSTPAAKRRRTRYRDSDSDSQDDDDYPYSYR